MTIAVVDTTVVIHLYRHYAPAQAWFSTLSEPLGITSITWMEMIYGAGSKAKQAACKTLLSQFDMVHLTSSDQDWAMEYMGKYRLSHGVTTNDCFIASVAYRLQIPLYTHNVKDMVTLIGTLALQPYV